MPKANPRLHDEMWLREQYLIKQRTYQDIGEEIGATKHGVYHAMQRYGIKARVHSSKYHQLNDKEWLRQMYVDQLLSTKQIADILGTTIGNIHSALTHCGIETRGYKEGLHVRFPDGRIGKDHPRWKGGLPLCIDCGRTTARREAIRCGDCEKNNNRLGKNNGNWRGGITKLNSAIRSCKLYRIWRKKIYERDDYTCQMKDCGIRGGDGTDTIMHADHIKPFALVVHENNICTLADALSCYELWNLDNGRVLCESCHRKTETYGGRLNNYKEIT